MSDNEQEELIANVLREIGFSKDELQGQNSEQLAVFEQILRMPSLGFRKLGLDAAIAAGSFGDWESSFLITERLLKGGDNQQVTKLWHIRSLVEREHFSEALALTTPIEWAPGLKVHADFLTATCYQRLKMQERAQDFVDAVKKVDPHYPGLIELNLD